LTLAVAYTRVNWKDRIVQRPRTYTAVTNSDGSRTDTPAPGTVAQAGVPINAANLNKMDKGVKDCADAINDALNTIATMQTAADGLAARVFANEQGLSATRQVNSEQSQDIAGLRNDLAAMNAVKLQAVTYEAEIPASGWSGSAAPYTRSVTVTGLLATDEPLVDVKQTGSYAADLAARSNWGLIGRIVTAANKITLTADAKPTAAFTIRMMCLRRG